MSVIVGGQTYVVPIVIKYEDVKIFETKEQSDATLGEVLDRCQKEVNLYYKRTPCGLAEGVTFRLHQESNYGVISGEISAGDVTDESLRSRTLSSLNVVKDKRLVFKNDELNVNDKMPIYRDIPPGEKKTALTKEQQRKSIIKKMTGF